MIGKKERQVKEAKESANKQNQSLRPFSIPVYCFSFLGLTHQLLSKALPPLLNPKRAASPLFSPLWSAQLG
jgi:hypothetical protein